MKTPSHDLFKLIQSMDMNEKRYFKLFSNLYGNNKHYIELFDLIEKQEDYDETKIRGELKNKDLAKQLAFYKNYLYQLILKSLRVYHSSRTLEQQLREELDNIKILMQKKQYQQCLRLINRTKTTAQKNEFHLIYIELLVMEEAIQTELQNWNWLKKEEKLNNKIINEEIKKFENERDFHILRNELHRQLKEFAEGDNGKKIFTRLKQHKLLKNPSNAGSNKCLHYFYNLNAFINIFFKRDNKKSTLYYQKDLAHIKLNMGIKHNERIYISTLNNLISSGVEFLSLAQAISITNELKNIKSVSKGQQREIMVRYYISTSRIYSHHARFREMGVVADEFAIWIKNNIIDGIDKTQEMASYSALATCYFISNKLKQALYWINRIVNYKEKSINDYLKRNAKIFQLIVHFELGNVDFVASQSKKLHAAYKKENSIKKFENLFFDFLQKMYNTNDLNPKTSDYLSLQKNLHKIFQDPLESTILEIFDVNTWLESKIKKQSFAETFKVKQEALRLN